MALLMARIDDRLVHGQVIIGCCEPLAADHVLVCDRQVAGDTLRRTLLAAAAPPEIVVEFVDPEDAVERIRGLQADDAHDSILLTRDAVTMASLVDRGIRLEAVVVGGAHDRPDTTERPDGWFLTDGERDALRTMVRRGVDVCFQPVPGSPAVDAAQVLGDVGS